MVCKSCGSQVTGFSGATITEHHEFEDGSPMLLTPGLPPGDVSFPESLCWKCWCMWAKTTTQKAAELYGLQSGGSEAAAVRQLDAAIGALSAIQQPSPSMPLASSRMGEAAAAGWTHLGGGFLGR